MLRTRPKEFAGILRDHMTLFEKGRPLIYVKDEVEIKTTEGVKCYLEAIELLE